MMVEEQESGYATHLYTMFSTVRQPYSGLGVNFTANPPVLTSEFPGGPASFVMSRSDGPDFLGYS